VLRAIVTFVPVAALLLIAPGPDSLLVLRNAARGGRRAGLAARWAGAAYLVFLGSQLIWQRRRRRSGEEATGRAKAANSHPLAEYLTGAGTNMLNPKVGIFFVSFLPVFIPRGVPVAPAAFILGSVFLTEGIVWLSVIALLGDRLNVVLSRASVRRRMEQLTGLVMIGFGVRLALERR
jgi:threonine/homoserine/homoserine lactone efflux protein